MEQYAQAQRTKQNTVNSLNGQVIAGKSRKSDIENGCYIVIYMQI